MKNAPNEPLPHPPTNFVRQIIEKDLETGKHQQIVTRFPPEPNGFLHVGHAKSICLNFGLAASFDGGQCNLRFDDTNPEKESQVYIDAIKADVSWLGFQWSGEVHYASDYFDQLFDYACDLINKGLAYVCGLDAEQTRAYRGTLTEPGTNSPDRDRSPKESLDLFMRMKAGEFDEGCYSLRLKIDMTSPNINLRDPVIYRIKKVTHHQTQDKWCVYPMYDYTHCISDALEGITHSVCTLEFEDHRPLYDWVLKSLPAPCHPQQIEFSRLNLSHTLTSKRKLKQLVDESLVEGWDDPRMPTIAGLRRRGYTPKAIRQFCEAIGVTKSDGIVDMAMLEFAIRDDLDQSAQRAMCVLNPLKVVLTNHAEAQSLLTGVPNHPKDESMGTRSIHFDEAIYIDRADFEEVPPPKYFRLSPGKEVRLRHAYVIRCDEVIKDPETSEVLELRCSIDLNTLGKKPEGRKVKGVIHWVSAQQGLPCEVRVYDRLFLTERPDASSDADWQSQINPQSLVIKHGFVESAIATASPETHFQFERVGYVVSDRHDHKPNSMIFNQVVGLRDSWQKINKS